MTRKPVNRPLSTMARSIPQRLQGIWVRLKWIGRVLQNVATGVEVSKSHPDRAIAIFWNGLPCWVQSWRVTRTIRPLVVIRKAHHGHFK